MGSFSDFGLMSQGMDEYNIRQKHIEGLTQNAQIRGQQIEAGEMGLEDVRRTRDTDAAVRDAAIKGSAKGQFVGYTFEDMAKALEARGDVQKALELRKGKKLLEDEGFTRVIDRAMRDPRPGKRPDLADEFNRYGNMRDMPQDLELDDRGNLWMTDARTGQRGSLNIGVFAKLLGLIKPKIGELAPGAIAYDETTGNTIASNPVNPDQDQKDVNHQHGYLQKSRKDSDGNEVQYWIDVRPTVDGKPNLNYGKEVAGEVGGGTGPGETNVRKDLQVLKEITEGVAELGAEYAQVDMTNPFNRQVTLTERGRQVALVAEQIRLANQSIAPRTAIDMAVNGKPMWKKEGGKRTGVVIYNGQEYPMATPSGTPVQRVGPTPPVPGAEQGHDGNWYIRQGDGWAKVITDQPAAPQPSAAPTPQVDTKKHPFAQTSEEDLLRAYRGARAAASQPTLPADLRRQNEQRADEAEAEMKRRGWSVEEVEKRVAERKKQADLALEAKLRRQQPGGRRAGLEPATPTEIAPDPAIGAMQTAPNVPEPTPLSSPTPGLDPEGGTPVRKPLFGSGGNPVTDLLKRGKAFEVEDPVLRSAGNLLRQLTASQGTTRSPSILRNAIEDYQTRLERLEKLRGRAQEQQPYAAGGRVINRDPYQRDPNFRESYQRDPNQ